MASIPEKPRSRAAASWLLILVVTLAAYWPALRGGFLWDDDGHVTKASLRSLAGLGRIWTQLGATQQYYPVLHSAFWVEHRLWGDSVLGYHLANILLHATAAWLFVLVLRLLWSSDSTDRIQVSGFRFHPSLLAGLLFALHPVCVESVAWISEQKNTLSLVFYLLSALVYLRWKLPSTGSDSGFRSQVSAFVLFLLALLSKSVTATLPAALLVVLWWRNGRLSWRKDVLPLVPWFAVGIAAGGLTAWVERHYGGAEGTPYALGALARCLLAGRIFWFYVAKLVWPLGLSFNYPRWGIDTAQVWQYAALSGALALAVVLWSARRRNRSPLAAFLLFAGSLIPALGFVNVYPFAYSYVADHFQYLASLGFLALVAAALAKWLPRPVLPVLPCVLGILTWSQSHAYVDLKTLYRTTIERNPGSWMAHTNLGLALAGEGRFDEAIPHYEAALRVDPGLWVTRNALGSALMSESRTTEAIAQFDAAIRLQPGYADAHFNLGVALRLSGNLPEAAREFARTLELRPGLSEASYYLGLGLVDEGRAEEAVARFRAAVADRPDFPEARFALGTTLAGLGRYADALKQLTEAVRLNPGFAQARYNRGAVLQRLGRNDEGAAEFAEARKQGFAR
jgi:protein O-mannosyl-transferase